MSEERYDKNNHLDLTHDVSLATFIGKTLGRFVSKNNMPHPSGDDRLRIHEHERERFARSCLALAKEILAYQETAKVTKTTLRADDFVIGMRASGDDVGEYFACAYCNREMPLASIADHVAAKHPNRKTSS